MTWDVRLGDCLDVMAAMDTASVDAIVTDPPAGIGFMGKHWDHDKGGRAQWIAWLASVLSEARRVLKPGGHAVVWSLPRTSHWTGMALEDAGFEVRDVVTHLFGSGFPKSLDVGKAMDKRRDDYPAVLAVASWLCARLRESGQHHTAVAAHFGVAESMVRHWIGKTGKQQTQCPRWEQWLALKALLGFGDEMDAEVWRLNGRKGQPGEAAALRGYVEPTGGLHGGSGNTVGRFTGRQLAPEPYTNLARQWDGWGTALKPAAEFWWLARKPLISTVAANVAAHGTGGLNIAACRIGTDPTVTRIAGGKGFGSNFRDDGWIPPEQSQARANPPGRWPANVCLDEAAAAALDAMSGERKAGVAVRHRSGGNTFGGENAKPPMEDMGYGDTGGPSRFFYTAKASRAEREAGLEGMEKRVRPEQSAWIRECRQCGDRFTDPATGKPKCGHDDVPYAPPSPARNHHPTVKPVALMRWLCRLVTPPGGLILDPFAGSGTTGIAAVREGFRFVGIEREAEYVEIARRRIAHAEATVEPDLFNGEAA